MCLEISIFYKSLRGPWMWSTFLQLTLYKVSAGPGQFCMHEADDMFQQVLRIQGPRGDWQS